MKDFERTSTVIPNGGSYYPRLMLGKKSGHVFLMVDENEGYVIAIGGGLCEPEKMIPQPYVGFHAIELDWENLEEFPGSVVLKDWRKR